MKKFFRLFSFAMTLVLIAALSAFSLQPAAATEKSMDIANNVIFISDSAANDDIAGDGSSPSKPLDPVAVPASEINEQPVLDANGNPTGKVYGKYYLNSALYQAAEKLANTGGTIVICGEVVIGDKYTYSSNPSAAQKDFNFPVSDKNLCITSVYDGIDYRELEEGKKARLVVEAPAQLNLNAPTVFQNIKIDTNGTTDRVICANANRIVMGEDITYTSGLSANKYISIAGGSRYSKINGDTDITIKSGYYNTVCGSSWGAGSGEYTNVGNITMTFEGGTFRNPITAGVRGNVNHKIDGDVTINIYKGAQFGGAIAMAGKGGFGSDDCEFTLNLYGGRLYSGAARLYNTLSSTTTSNTLTQGGYKAAKININLSAATTSTITPLKTSSQATYPTVDELLNSFIVTAEATGVANQNVIHSSAWATQITAASTPSATYVLENGTVSSEGAVLNVNYTNPITSKTDSAQISYSDTDHAFTVSCNTKKVGNASVSYKYGSTVYHTDTIKVLNAPEVQIIGAKVKSTDKYYQGLKFIGYYTDEQLDAGVTVSDYGFIGIPADLCPNSSALNFEDTYGMTIVRSSSLVDQKTIGNRKHFAGVITSSLRPNQYNVDYHARAYVELTYNNDTLYVYSDIIERNPYEVAKRAVQDGSLETEATKSNLQTNVIDKFDNYDETKNYLSPTALRTKVVNAMRDQMNLKWKPSDTFYIYNDGTSGVKTDLYFEEGTYYLGIPYTNNDFSQKETFSDYIVDGVLQLDLIGGIVSDTTDPEIAHDNYLKFPGSDCSTAVITSWNTVINNRMELKNLYMTKYMVPNQNSGTLPVGDYDYSFEKYGTDTTLMTSNWRNAAKIKKAYESLQPGDAIVTYSTSGHVRMVVSVNKTDETVTTIECANWSTSKAEETYDGSGVYYVSWKEKTYTFYELLNTGYIPITIPELVTGCSDSEYTYVTDLNLKEDLPEGKLTGKAISNRQIISVDISVNDGTDTTEIRYRPPTSTKYTQVHVPSVDLSQIDLSKFKLQSGKTYTFSLNIRVAGLTEAHPTVKLIKDYEFTVK